MGRFENYTYDLLNRPEVQRLARCKDHHFKQNRLEHCIATARLSYRLARLLGANQRTCARAAFLHDWYFEGRSEHENRVGANVHHYRIAEANARGIGEPNAVTSVIASHMWPYGRRAPNSIEGWIVWMADNVTWVSDGLRSLSRYVVRKTNSFMYGSPYRPQERYAS